MLESANRITGFCPIWLAIRDCIRQKTERRGGRPKLEATKLREALIAEAEKRAAPLAKVLMDKAMTGDVPAIREMMDRALGKALQSFDHTSQGEKMPVPILVHLKPDDDDESKKVVE